MSNVIITFKHLGYPIFIGEDLLNNIQFLYPLACGDRVMLVTDSYIAPIYLNLVLHSLKKFGIKVDWIILPDGERTKSLSILNKVFTVLLDKSHDRNTTIIAFGGGVIGDLSGFVAATYYRGVRLIQIPTTLLSQVDSSIGSKNMINHPLGKNIIGSFYHPSSVIIDINYLRTLSKKEISSGLAEIIKYGIVSDEKLFFWLERNIDLLIQLNRQEIIHCITKCCRIKIDIVLSDERDKSHRLVLNFGHTYGHAIETYMKYRGWSHGQAISVGMVMAARLANLIGQLNETDFERIRTLLLRAGLPVVGPSTMQPERYLSYMIKDKKVINGKINLILPIRIGYAEIRDDINKNLIIESIKKSM